jgi:hypothetical protein
METLFGLPKKVIFCNRCVISNQRPSSTIEFLSDASEVKKTIEFGDGSICEACKYGEVKEVIDWNLREKKLINLCDEYRQNSGYDVVVPGSGGER